jgi:membrane protein required for beta-lactamase induction
MLATAGDLLMILLWFGWLVLPFLILILFMLICRSSIDLSVKRWKSRPAWSAKDDAELRDLMR